MNDADFTAMARKIATALATEMAGRFVIVANPSAEEAEGSPTRTIQVVDRWSDQDCTLEIRCGVKPSAREAA